ncbi:hypothetical protein AB6A40_002763 [Gnathostoma spinigerum]|uniref:E3 UFM1-protein ligase 1 homolog n=1 Tax=Gnathostoma spinigerum TaxID=75299 RepID=A0ABD6EFC4_9BILA
MSTTWADIQKLAADFQRVQLAERGNILSEKNCIEVVSKLIASNAIDAVFTKDGRTYITKKHLLTEVKNECIAHDGRISLTELSHALNIEFEHVEEAVFAITKSSTSFVLCAGEIITNEYVNKLCDELNSRLANVGQISVSELVRTWDLPGEIINGLVLKQIGEKINAVRDGDIICTMFYLDSQKNILRAILNSLTKVTLLSKIESYVCLPSSFFWSSLDDLISRKEVPGTFIGGRQLSSGFYVPNIHSLRVQSFVLRTLERDRILEVSTLKKLFVTDVDSYLKNIRKDSRNCSLIVLPSSIIAESLLTEIEQSVQTEVSDKLFCDVVHHVPPQISTTQDIASLLATLSKKHKEWITVQDSSVLYTRELLVHTLKSLGNFISEKAKEEAEARWNREKTAVTNDFSDKKLKKKKTGRAKNLKANDDDSPKHVDTLNDTVRISKDALFAELERIQNIPYELIDEVAERIITSIESAVQERVDSIIYGVEQENAQSQKRSHAQMKEKVRNLYENICLFEQGTSEFSASVAADLQQYLMRTFCTDMCRTLLLYLSGVSRPSAELSVKARDEMINTLESKECRDVMTDLYLATTSSEFNAFHECVSRLASPAVCSLNLKMPDRKRRVEIVSTYREELRKQLEESDDPAAGLLLAILFLLARNGIAVNASGKFVSHLLAKLETVMKNESSLLGELQSTQRLVVASIKKKDDKALKDELTAKLESLKTAIFGLDIDGNDA